jgi:hypothetical protein
MTIATNAAYSPEEAEQKRAEAQAAADEAETAQIEADERAAQEEAAKVALGGKVGTRTFDYVKYDPVHAEIQEEFRNKFQKIEALVEEKLPGSRHTSLVKTKLEEAYMWVGKAVRDMQIKATAAEHEPNRTNSPE